MTALDCACLSSDVSSRTKQNSAFFLWHLDPMNGCYFTNKFSVWTWWFMPTSCPAIQHLSDSNPRPRQQSCHQHDRYSPCLPTPLSPPPPCPCCRGSCVSVSQVPASTVTCRRYWRQRAVASSFLRRLPIAPDNVQWSAFHWRRACPWTPTVTSFAMGTRRWLPMPVCCTRSRRFRTRCVGFFARYGLLLGPGRGLCPVSTIPLDIRPSLLGHHRWRVITFVNGAVLVLELGPLVCRCGMASRLTGPFA